MATHITIGDISPRIQYTGDGTQVAFTYPFPIFADADIEVYEDATLKILTTDYTVAGAGESNGGSVTLNTAPTSGVVVTLRRNMTVARTTDFQESGEFRAKVINDELDKQVAFTQQVEEDLGRSLRLSATDAAATLELPVKADRLGKVLAFDPATGEPVSSTTTLSAIESGAADAAASAAVALASETAAASSETAAASSEAAAAASAAAAAASAGSGPYTTVTVLTTGTYDIEVVGSRTYYVCDTSGGAITVNLPLIGTDEGTTFGFERSGGNAVSLNRDGTDTINAGAGPYILSADTEVVRFIADDNTTDNWIATIQSQTLAGDGLAKSGSTVSLDRADKATWTGAQRATATVDNDGSFDLDAAQNFKCTPAGAVTVQFTNEAFATDQSGIVLFDNSGGHAITKGAEVHCDSDFLTTVSMAGVYLVGYFCDGTNVYVGYTGGLSA